MAQVESSRAEHCSTAEGALGIHCSVDGPQRCSTALGVGVGGWTPILEMRNLRLGGISNLSKDRQPMSTRTDMRRDLGHHAIML